MERMERVGQAIVYVQYDYYAGPHSRESRRSESQWWDVLYATEYGV